MIKILFVCHGNICRSPMAEFLFRDLCTREGFGSQVYIESAATSTEEIGNPVYPPARRLLQQKGIDCSGKRARQITKKDYENFDYLITMDSQNNRNARRIWKTDDEHKIMRMLDITDRPRDIADPWYTGDFEKTYEDIMEGSRAWLGKLVKRGWK
ncbi:MAG: low molecular weight phosphotyrosine protein phosphatase [Eubacterium sp.]|nr:low molecular weight phosphotyrosine protein phosphatase [Eubacterium sp.]